MEKKNAREKREIYELKHSQNTMKTRGSNSSLSVHQQMIVTTHKTSTAVNKTNTPISNYMIIVRLLLYFLHIFFYCYYFCSYIKSLQMYYHHVCVCEYEYDCVCSYVWCEIHELNMSSIQCAFECNAWRNKILTTNCYSPFRSICYSYECRSPEPKQNNRLLAAHERSFIYCV